MFNAIMIRPGEYMVRAHTRSAHLSRLKESIIRGLKRHGLSARVRVVSNVRVVLEDLSSPVDEFVKVLNFTPGISSFSPVVRIGGNFSNLVETIVDIIKANHARRFKIEVQGDFRSKKDFTALLSKAVADASGCMIDLAEPDLTIGVDIRKTETYVFTRVYKGIGGLPYGSQGCGVVLFSGGVDSAVAALLALKRGLALIPVFIDMTPYWSMKARERALEGLSLLASKTPWDELKIYIVRDAWKLLKLFNIPEKYRCLACKINMYRIAGLIAEKENCNFIVTGESLGQVASQTSSNLRTLDSLAPAPVLRPLIFTDKEEIIGKAREFGFSSLSREVGGCSLKPSNPATSSDESVVLLLQKFLMETEKEASAIVSGSEIVYM